MPRHTRTWKERYDTPDRRTFVLQLYDNVESTDRFEDEAKLLDTMAVAIDVMLFAPGVGCTSIRHDSKAFHCYVGSCPEDKALIIQPRSSSVLDWDSTRRHRWAKNVAATWSVSGRAPVDGNDPPRPEGTTERAATHTVSTGGRRG